MARWAIANMNRGELDGVRILKASIYDVMWKPSGEFGGKPSPAGISWFPGEFRGDRMICHNGGDTGFLTGLAMLPEKKIAVVWMTNAEWLPGVEDVTHAALDVALGLKPQPIIGKRSVGQAMFVADGNGGIDAAIKQYEVLKKVRPDAYNFGVGQRVRAAPAAEGPRQRRHSHFAIECGGVSFVGRHF
jgi:CubicO group peptidase (beta-lactamase class C family)